MKENERGNGIELVSVHLKICATEPGKLPLSNPREIEIHVH